MFVQCEICKRLQTISGADWKYLDRDGDFCCSKDCIKEWLSIVRTPGSYQAALIDPSADFCYSAKTRQTYRSRYEMYFAEWLQAEQIPHYYELVEFYWDSGKRYTPDFYFPETQSFVEIKGAWGPSQKSKLASFRAHNPTVSVLVVPWTLADQFYPDEEED